MTDVEFDNSIDKIASSAFVSTKDRPKGLDARKANAVMKLEKLSKKITQHRVARSARQKTARN